MRMLRRVTFSSGHRYWNSDWSADENRARFGPWASPYNHGHNYVLDVTVEGEVDPVDGMVVNIKRVDDVLKREVLSRFDQRSINDEIPEFRDRAPSLENLLNYFRDLLGSELYVDRYFPDRDGRDTGDRDGPTTGHATVRLVNLRLEEMPTFYGELDLETDMTTLTRIYEFAAAHRLNAPALSEVENLALYGKCNHPNGHGHNYVLEVTVSGEVDPVTGMLADLGELDQIVEREVLDRYDHRNLDMDVPELVDKVTTSENVAQAIFDRLTAAVPGRLSRIRLWETARNCFEVSA